MDAGLLPLLARTTVSLAVVLAVVAVAYLIARRRAGGRAAAPRTSASGGTSTRRKPPAPPLEIVGRVGLSRGIAAVALRFGDRVVLIGAGEQAPTSVLAEMDADRWQELVTARESLAAEHTVRVPVDGQPQRSSLLDALRTATTRHA